LSNLKNYKAKNTLKKATLQFIASQLVTKDEKFELSKQFKSFDTNGDGRLDMQEIKDGYAKYYNQQMTDQEVEKIFNDIDVDNNGYIEYTEFISAAMNMDTLVQNNKIARAF
jgi:calcium-dependent protein kinase